MWNIFEVKLTLESRNLIIFKVGNNPPEQQRSVKWFSVVFVVNLERIFCYVLAFYIYIADGNATHCTEDEVSH